MTYVIADHRNVPGRVKHEAQPLSEYLAAGVHQVCRIPGSSPPAGEYTVVMSAHGTNVSQTVVLPR